MEGSAGKILYVEDDAVDLMAFKKSVKKERFPYEYVTAKSVQEALKILDSEKFDAVVTDYSLGDGIALDILKTLDDTPVIVVTGVGDEETAVQAMKSGAYDYLVKDIHKSYLTALPNSLANAISYKKTQDELKKYQHHLEELVEERTAELQKEINQRKQKEEELSLKNYAVESSISAVAFVDLEGNLTYVNKAFLEMWGYKSVDEVLGKPATKFWLLGKAASAVMEACRSLGSSTGELIAVKKNGITLDVYISANMVYDDNEAPVCMMLSIIDISSRKRMEEELRQSERKYRSYIDNAPDGVFITNKRGEYIEVNPAACRITGYSKEELTNMSIPDMVPSEDTSRAMKLFQKMVREGYSSGEVSYLRKSGEKRWWRVDAVKLSENRYLGFVKDTTDRREALEELFQRQQEFRALSENSPDIIARFDRDFRHLYINKAVEDITNIPVEEFIGKTHEELGLDDDFRRHRTEKFQQIFDTGQELSYEFSVDTPEGLKHMESRMIPEFDQDGDIETILVVTRDITELKKTEEELKQYQWAVESSDELIAAVDRNYKYLFANSAFLKYHKINWDKLAGKSVKDVVGEKEFIKIKETLDRSLAGKSEQNERLYVDPETDEQRYISISYYPLRNNNNISGVVIIARDITEKRKMEQEMRKIDTLNSIGTLAGGIAHDFNNILTGIWGNISYSRTIDDPEAKEKRLASAERACIKAEHLTQQLLAFSKGGAPIKEFATIDETLRDSAIFTLRGSNVKCEFQIPDDLWTVEIDQGQISQVINNLVINAKQAMPHGGVINIKADNIMLDKD
ncbi:PAS domain S-box protein, partial [Candidatus Poribacteria bacterium]|nr:PAS domain S-box protein [Candidatus Poribacteria bacterium]